MIKKKFTVHCNFINGYTIETFISELKEEYSSFGITLESYDYIPSEYDKHKPLHTVFPNVKTQIPSKMIDSIVITVRVEPNYLGLNLAADLFSPIQCKDNKTILLEGIPSDKIIDNV